MTDCRLPLAQSFPAGLRVAFHSATFGKSKEPFWQQASTNLVKFVILLHKTLDDYVTLFQVYEHVINPDKLRIKIAEGEQRFAAKNRRVFVDRLTCLSAPSPGAWTWQREAPGDRLWTQWACSSHASCKEIELPYQPVRYEMADAIDCVLHLGRPDATHVVRALIRVERHDATRDCHERDEKPSSSNSLPQSIGGHS